MPSALRPYQEVTHLTGAHVSQNLVIGPHQLQRQLGNVISSRMALCPVPTVACPGRNNCCVLCKETKTKMYRAFSMSRRRGHVLTSFFSSSLDFTNTETAGTRLSTAAPRGMLSRLLGYQPQLVFACLPSPQSMCSLSVMLRSGWEWDY